MSDRINTITVVLENDMRDDDCKAVLDAIRMVKHVLQAEPNIVDPRDWAAETRARKKLTDQLWEVIYPKTKT